MVNIVICGTPCTGKSSLVDKLEPLLPEFNFVNVSKFAIKNNCIENYDATLDSQILDEKKLETLLVDSLKEKKNNIIETIHSDLLPEEVVDYIFVCRTNNTILYDRLKARNYNEAKMENNLDAEVFQTVLDDAKEFFDETIVSELINNNEKDLDENVQTIIDRVNKLLSK